MYIVFNASPSSPSFYVGGYSIDLSEIVDNFDLFIIRLLRPYATRYCITTRDIDNWDKLRMSETWEYHPSLDIVFVPPAPLSSNFFFVDNFKKDEICYL